MTAEEPQSSQSPHVQIIPAIPRGLPCMQIVNLCRSPILSHGWFMVVMQHVGFFSTLKEDLIISCAVECSTIFCCG